jgi:hypothetical protein
LVIAAIGAKDNHDFEVLKNKYAKIAQLSIGGQPYNPTAQFFALKYTFRGLFSM